MMRYSTEARDRTYIKGYGFFSFAKNMGKNLSKKYRQNPLDTTKSWKLAPLRLPRKVQSKKQQKGRVI